MLSLCNFFGILLIILRNSRAIIPEYYLDSENDFDEVILKNITGVRRYYDENEVTIINSTSVYKPNDEDEYNDEWFLSTESTTKLLDKISLENIKELFSSQNTTLDSITTPQMLNTTSTKSTINIFQHYEYIYDELEPFKLYQRQRYDIPIRTTTDKNSDTKVNNSIRYLADFYNLVPALHSIEINDPLTFNKTDNVWYIPEKYPCWELPVLYGRLGQRKLTSDIFFVFSGKLKNVVHAETEKSITDVLIDFEFDGSKSINKWCMSAPCFGDHTLCVFSDKKISRVCDMGYKVKWPLIIEEIAIVNTLNSMRSSIAHGLADQYAHLPTAANIRQVIYDSDLEEMAIAWLRQCLPGIDPCSSIDNGYVTQLECTKCAEYCCSKNIGSDCIPKQECFINPVLGCLYEWFGMAKEKLTTTDVKCGYASPETLHTVQLIWANTYKIGCAYGVRPNGDVRVVCNFAPGAPFYVESKYFCGFIAHRDITEYFHWNYKNKDITDLTFLESLGIKLDNVFNINQYKSDNETNKFSNLTRSIRMSDLDTLNEIYKPGWVRSVLEDYSNGTLGMIARVVTQYTFMDGGQSKCDTNESIYVIGQPGSRCIERGRKYNGLCYDFSDPTPGYRLAAILAPIAIFSLILYDLFSGVMRETVNY